VAFSFDRTSATTSWPAACASLTMALPVPPVAPNTKIFIVISLLQTCASRWRGSISQGLGGYCDACDMPSGSAVDSLMTVTATEEFTD